MTRARLVAAALALAAAGALAACPKRGPGAVATPVGDPFSGESGDETPVLRRELEAEVLESYERDDTSQGDDWTGVLDPDLGVVRFGVGPKDESVTTAGPPPPRHLPLGLSAGGDDPDNPACPQALRSKQLELHLSADGGTAWVADEVAACVTVCGKQAIVPLRLSAVYVRGGDRWILAVEHLSYAQPAAALIARREASATPVDAVTSARSWGPSLRALVARAVAATAPADRALDFATGDGALAWWPDPAHELRAGAITAGPSLTDAFDASAIRVENARIGMGPAPGGGPGVIAWWAGTIVVSARDGAAVGAAPGKGSGAGKGAGKGSGAAAGSGAPPPAAPDADATVRLRATFVLRRDPDRWHIVQSHVSAPIDDDALAALLASGARFTDGKVDVTCADVEDTTAGAGAPTPPGTPGEGARAPTPPRTAAPAAPATAAPPARSSTAPAADSR